MTLKGFFFLFAVTLAGIVLGALVADRVAAPGLGRTLVVALIATPIVLGAGVFAERRGWVSGAFDFGRRQDVHKGKDSTGDRK